MLGKGFLDFFQRVDADVVCLQETKLQPDQIALELPGYRLFWNSAEKKGYSGTAVFTGWSPCPSPAASVWTSTTTRAGSSPRSSTLLPGLLLHPQRPERAGPHRLPDAVGGRLPGLPHRAGQKRRPVVLCGDLNVAHEEIDLKNPKSNRGQRGLLRPGAGQDDRAALQRLYRHLPRLYPDRTGAYTWWSYRFNARKNNAGWRIDYFIVSDRLLPRVRDNIIHAEVEGSDHCPVELVLD